jgi:hypothetical protein
MKFTVHQVDSLCWPFDSEPYFIVSGGDYVRHEKVDPFPGYAHSALLVENMCDDLNEVMPCGGQTDIYLPEWEGQGRTNGHECQQSYYDEKGRFGATIVLSGKRIPIHPAMTRYLVTHEYGHVVEDWVQFTYGVTNLRYAYCKDLRAHESHSKYYGGKTWHAAPGEIFANDFRVVVAQAELDFWPHEPVPFPYDVKIQSFWHKAADYWPDALAMLPSLQFKDKDKE